MYHYLSILDNQSAIEIIQIIAALPARVTSLNLDANNLGYRTADELTQIFTALPTSVTRLRLYDNNLGFKTEKEIAQVFAAIPASVEILDLGYNNLGNKTGAELAQAFAAIPTSVTSLYLGGNNLDNNTGDELAQAFAAIPASVTSLNLRFNNLHNKTGDELAQAFAAIPASVTNLNLSGNDLGLKTGAELVQAFAAIPASVTNLNLSDNDLGLKTGAELVQAFAAIPASVTNLNLSDNDLGLKTTAELAQAIAALPASVRSLNLSGYRLSAQQVEKIIKALPKAIESVVLNYKTIYFDKTIAKNLKTQVALLCSKNGAEQLRFDTIKLTTEIDETRLNRVVEVLGKQNDPLADLTCGLLLEGQIDTTADMIDNCSAFDEYMEKRTQDAISFYTKATEDKTIKPIVEFLLWEMKLISPIPSVQKRLSYFDLSPQTICDSFSQASKTRTEVNLPLYSHLSFFKPLQESEESTEELRAANNSIDEKIVEEVLAPTQSDETSDLLKKNDSSQEKPQQAKIEEKTEEDPCQCRIL